MADGGGDLAVALAFGGWFGLPRCIGGAPTSTTFEPAFGATTGPGLSGALRGAASRQRRIERRAGRRRRWRHLCGGIGNRGRGQWGEGGSRRRASRSDSGSRRAASASPRLGSGGGRTARSARRPGFNASRRAPSRRRARAAAPDRQPLAYRPWVAPESSAHSAAHGAVPGTVPLAQPPSKKIRSRFISVSTAATPSVDSRDPLDSIQSALIQIPPSPDATRADPRHPRFASKHA